MRKLNVHAGISFASIALALLVIIAELAEPFKNLLKAVFWHHWVGKVVLTTAVFLICSYFLKNKELFGKPIEKISFAITSISLTVILLFFIAHYFL